MSKNIQVIQRIDINAYGLTESLNIQFGELDFGDSFHEQQWILIPAKVINKSIDVFQGMQHVWGIGEQVLDVVAVFETTSDIGEIKAIDFLGYDLAPPYDRYRFSEVTIHNDGRCVIRLYSPTPEDDNEIFGEFLIMNDKETHA